MSAAKEINLLPLKFRQRIALRGILTSWAWVAAAMGTICGIQIALVSAGHEHHRERMALLRDSGQPVFAALEQQETLRARQAKLLDLRHRAASLLPSDDLLQTLGAIATATVDSASTGARIQTLRIDLRGAQPRPVPTSEAAANSTTHVAFTAVARDAEGLTALIARLRQNPRFHEVRLRATAEHESNGGRRAEVEAEVLVEKELPQ